MLCACLGTGGIRPSVVAFGADQFDHQAEAEAWANRKRRYFNRNAAAPEDTGLLYQDKELDAPISTKGRLLHTNKHQVRLSPT
ncbi:hypothetical protein PR202_gb01221 [Eleusine coracana subsp. coracana]|uniref:Uncharacterized protein n=1 Tax=Eleusine coracana subsp. coracana TaxID=191504 RepID=A0AAV5DTU1_ELECO|nr:hypothetical protein PR202_gb01221 [Eleusine coracana subsp. coracana]